MAGTTTPHPPAPPHTRRRHVSPHALTLVVPDCPTAPHLGELLEQGPVITLACGVGGRIVEGVQRQLPRKVAAQHLRHQVAVGEVPGVVTGGGARVRGRAFPLFRAYPRVNAGRRVPLRPRGLDRREGTYRRTFRTGYDRSRDNSQRSWSRLKLPIGALLWSVQPFVLLQTTPTDELLVPSGGRARLHTLKAPRALCARRNARSTAGCPPWT